MIDDLGFDADYGSLDPLAPQLIEECNAAPPCWHCTAETKRTARVAEKRNEFQRQRREENVDDVRTTRLVKLLNVANKLTELNHDINNLVLHDEGDASLKLLRCRLEKAERVASDIYRRELEVANG